MNRLGLRLFNLACKLEPAIPLAMLHTAEQHGLRIAQQHLDQVQAAQALALHQQVVAQRAARQ